MNRNELVLVRPRHALDVRAYTAHVLAGIGALSLAAARSVNDGAVRGRSTPRPPYSEAVRARHRSSVDGVGENWRIR